MLESNPINITEQIKIAAIHGQEIPTDIPPVTITCPEMMLIQTTTTVPPTKSQTNRGGLYRASPPQFTGKRDKSQSFFRKFKGFIGGKVN